MTKRVLILLGFGMFGLSGAAEAANTCAFATVGTTMTLLGDCSTDATLSVPDGFTLDGNGFTITAVDPPGGHFVGAVIRNAGPTAHVVDLTVTTLNLANVCDGGDDRLRGIMFQGASGSIRGNTVVNLNQGASGCQEGNAIEVRNFGDLAGTATVEITGNAVSSFQKTGILTNGDVDAAIHHNTVNGSATQANLAANGIQVGFGAKASVMHNSVAGNSWAGPDAAATAILLYQFAAGTAVRQNNLMDGNADVGIYIAGDGALVDNNRVFESGPDGFYDIGIGDYGIGNAVTNNKVRGYGLAYDGVTTGNNKAIPSPHDS
jgi:hypothetical protein